MTDPARQAATDEINGLTLCELQDVHHEPLGTIVLSVLQPPWWKRLWRWLTRSYPKATISHPNTGVWINGKHIAASDMKMEWISWKSNAEPMPDIGPVEIKFTAEAPPGFVELVEGLQVAEETDE